MKYPHARLLVFSKAPVPGQVKTRLIPLLGAEAAAELYADMLDETLDKVVTAGLCPVELWCTPDAQHACFRRCHDRYPLLLRQQGTGDLGSRMSQALHCALQEARHAVLIGADIPALGAADIDVALAALAAGTDVVLGPAADGGYYLIGMSVHYPGLFENVAWGSPQVLAMTLAQCGRDGLNWASLPEHADVDTPDDYRRHCAARQAAPASISAVARDK
jgi:rSAM/selenodomain-associated transferase 1